MIKPSSSCYEVSIYGIADRLLFHGPQGGDDLLLVRVAGHAVDHYAGRQDRKELAEDIDILFAAQAFVAAREYISWSTVPLLT